jgi:hypothetical protein
MSELENGMLVQHTSLGMGKVVALEANAVHVFFPDGEKRFAAKLRLPLARPFLRTEGVESNTWLEGLSSFVLDPETGRYGLAATWITHDQAIAQFLAAQPGGFAAPKEGAARRASRAASWRAAHEAWADAFGRGQGERLLAAEDVPELVRRALGVERLVRTLHPDPERDALKEALVDPAASHAFFGALLELLAVPAPPRARFDKLFSAAAALPGAPSSRWPIATLFPFLAQPERHPFLRRKWTCEAAERLGCDLRYHETPGWTTYAALRKLSTQLLERLRAIGARDFIDVEAFLYVTATKRPRAVAGQPRRSR